MCGMFGGGGGANNHPRAQEHVWKKKQRQTYNLNALKQIIEGKQGRHEASWSPPPGLKRWRVKEEEKAY